MQNASKNDDYASIADAGGLIIIAGDPAAEDEPMRKGTCLQVSTALTLGQSFSWFTKHTLLAMASGLRVPVNTDAIPEGPDLNSMFC